MSCEQLIDTLLKTCDIKCKNCGEPQTHYSELLLHLKKCQKVTLKYTENQELLAEKAKSWMLSRIIEDNLKINLSQIVTEPEKEPSTPPKKIGRKKLRKNPNVVKTEEVQTDDDKIVTKLEEIKRKSEIEFTFKKKELLDRLRELKDSFTPELSVLRLHILRYYGVERWEKLVRTQFAQLVKAGKGDQFAHHFSCLEQRLLNKVSDSSNVEEEVRNYEKALYTYHKESTPNFSPSLMIDYRVYFMPIYTMFESYFEMISSHFLWTAEESFYVRIDNMWNLDWGLEITVPNLHQDLITYITSLFRNNYTEIFGDNYYRSGFINFFKERESDVKQLLANAYYLSDGDKVEKDFTQLVKKNCKGTFSDKEKIPMGVIPKKTRKIKVSQGEILEKLFDSISGEEMKEFKKKLEENFTSS